MIDAVFWGTMIPLVFLIILLKGESRLMMLFFAWGMVAFALSLVVNNLARAGGAVTPGELSLTWAPIIEEFFKALPLVYFLIRKQKTAYPLFSFALAAGIGFSIQENYTYLLSQAALASSLTFYVILRSITTCLMHGMATGLLGFGLTLIREFRVLKLPLLFGLFSLSVILHALFNLYIASGARLIGMLMPILLYMASALVIYRGNILNTGATSEQNKG
ncbi:MAG: PrsW family intramembrane metalloprotease [Clostridiales bacterium]|nr:PrsW family intramembrane metalloprotease [Clostridiales bacterium]